MLIDLSQKNFYFVLKVNEDKSLSLVNFSKNKNENKVPVDPAFSSALSIQVAGENPDEHHFAKHSGCSSERTLKYKSHEYYENEFGNKAEICLEDDRMRAVIHYQFYESSDTVRSCTVVTNIASEPLGLEYVSSFAYTGISEGQFDGVYVYIPNNVCVNEMNWRRHSLSELGFTKNSLKRHSVYNTGTWSTKEFLPMAIIENTVADNTYIFQIENNGSWQWELAGALKRSGIYLKLSGPTENENHWYKELKQGESFESVTAAVSVGKDLNSAIAQLTAYRRQIYTPNKENAGLPVIFNDYMNCLWADPTEEKEFPVIDLAAEMGAEYYCMDAGWYSEGGWWDLVGEWLPCEKRFPHGIKAVFDRIRERGMVPGLWIEIEVMGINCPLAKEWEDECFFMRHGKRVIDHGRYLLDFRNKKVREHASAVVRRLVNEYGIEYIKSDYNVEGGHGTELYADSTGDGLLGHCRAYFEWLKDIHKEFPFLIVENCGSGGMRMDYKLLSLLGIQSTSDQTDYLLTSHIAAASSVAVLPEQAARWVYPLGQMDVPATQFNMVNGLLGRIHLSGQIFDWSDEQKEAVKEGIRVYKEIRADIPNSVPFYPLGIPCYDDGIFCSAYRTPSSVRISVWRHSGEDSLFIPVDTPYKNVRILYPSSTDASVERVEGGVKVVLPTENTAVIAEISD